MIEFIRDSFRELEHVVWPSKSDSRKYMYYTVGIIVFMTLYLSLLGYMFRSTFKEARHQINPNAGITTTTDSTPATQKDLEDLYKQFNMTGLINSGNVNTGTTVTTGTTLSTQSGIVIGTGSAPTN